MVTMERSRKEGRNDYAHQCRIKGGAKGAAVLGARSWWEWLAGYRSVRGPHLAQHPGPN